MSDGASNPFRDSAAKAASRASAVSAALADEMSDTPAEEVTQEPATAEPDVAVSAPEPDAEQETASTPGASAGPQDQAPPAGGQLSAPKEWPKDRQTEFNALPEAAKRILLDRNKEFTNGIRQKSEESADHRKRSEALTEVLKPYDADLRNAGMDQVGAVRWMIQERESFNRDPAGFLLGYAKNAQVDIAKFIAHLAERAGLTQDQLPAAQQPPQQQTDPGQAEWWQDDPAYKAQQAHIEALKGEIASLKQNFTSYQSQYDQREKLTLQEELQSFMTATDPAGNPTHPHYEALKPIMQRLMNTDPEIANIPDWKAQQKLQAAYDKAIWLNGDIRQSLIDEQVNQKLSAQTQQASVDKAKAATTKKGSPGANGAAQPGRMSRKDAVAAALRDSGLA